MISLTLSSEESRDIDAVVRKVVRGLGNPEPPLRLDDVRELQRLDRAYYSSSDDSALRETISRLRVAGKQLFAHPRLLLDVIRESKLSALWLPDRRRILIDSDIPDIKQRWAEAHEVGHSLVPWHKDYLLGDDVETLNLAFREQLEAEANYAAGQLLFLQDKFRSEAGDSALNIQSVKDLSKRYGNTITSTLWRFIESHTDQAIVGVVTKPSTGWSEEPADLPCRYFIPSVRFSAEYPAVTEAQIADIVANHCRCSSRRRGPLGTYESLLTNARGEDCDFHFESFSNTYDILTIGQLVGPHPVIA